jgi:hypothetical protein
MADLVIDAELRSGMRCSTLSAVRIRATFCSAALVEDVAWYCAALHGCALVCTLLGLVPESVVLYCTVLYCVVLGVLCFDMLCRTTPCGVVPEYAMEGCHARGCLTTPCRATVKA